MRIHSFIETCLVALICGNVSAQSISLISSKGGSYLNASTIDFNTPLYPNVITIDPSQTFQKMDGVGAAFTGSTAYVFKYNLSTAQRAALLNDLFLPSGVGINYLRISIGSSDFSVGSYNYCMERDTTLNSFSIAPDTLLIRMLKEVLAVNPSVKILASPWSPPGWMKNAPYNNTMNGGTLNPFYYSAFANYYIKYLQTMQAKGIPIDAMTLQNEPENITTSYPSMGMTDAVQQTIIRDYLGPRMVAAGLHTKILVYDHNCDDPQYPITVMSDPKAKQYIAGSAFHLYAGSIDAMSTVKAADPDKDIYFTEQSGGAWAPNIIDNLVWDVVNLIAGAPRNWSRNVLFWNLALNSSLGPQNGGCSNCYGVVDIDGQGNLQKNAEYYALAHYGKVVQQNALRIASNNVGSITDVAFLNPDGSIAIIAANNNTVAYAATFKIGNQSLNYQFSDREVISILIPSVLVAQTNTGTVKLTAYGTSFVKSGDVLCVKGNVHQADIYSATGQLMAHFMPLPTSAQLPIGTLPQGMYMVLLDGVCVGKFIKN